MILPATSPPIFEAQNEPSSLRLLAAQRRLYSDAKIIHSARLWVVTVGALTAIIASLLLPSARVTAGIISGLALFLLSALGGAQEKKKCKEAASIQEELDTKLFQLPWNRFLADPPTATLVTEAARRYKGAPMKNWYSDTSDIDRPLDVLLCQRSNLGWGSTLHRKWRIWLVSALVLLITGLILIGIVTGSTLGETLASVFVPSLPLAKEIIEQARAHADNSRSKETAEVKILGVMREVIAGQRLDVTVEECRTIQDQILFSRQTNASIPDWFNKRNHANLEQAMIDSTEDLIEKIKKTRNKPPSAGA